MSAGLQFHPLLDSFPEVRRQLAAHVTDEWEKMREHRKGSVQYGGSMSERGGLEIPEVPLRLGPNGNIQSSPNNGTSPAAQIPQT